jgi:predicted  nucleic acid-binding Zn-ribbon protein
MDDSIRVRCTNCRTVFRDRAHRVQSGFSRQCPSCEVVLFFEDSSNDPNIQRALAEAQRTRAAIR